MLEALIALDLSQEKVRRKVELESHAKNNPRRIWSLLRREPDRQTVGGCRTTSRHEPCDRASTDRERVARVDALTKRYEGGAA